MEQEVAREFHDVVSELIPSEKDRDKFFQALKDYQSSLDLSLLLACAKGLIHHPDDLLFFEELRSLIPPNQQLQYDRQAPRMPTGKLHVIRLSRKQNENLGFSVRGGLEHDVGVFVSHVQRDSQAYHAGLRAGDEIVRINGYTISQAIHEEALNLIRIKPEIILKVRSIGMIPEKQRPTEGVSWKYIERKEMKRSPKVPAQVSPIETEFEEVKLCVHVIGGSLGCSICSGPLNQPGIFIQSVREGSLAQETGLEVGDQIVEVNGTRFFNVSHSEAILALKESTLLNLTLWKGTGLHLFLSPERLAEVVKKKHENVELSERLTINGKGKGKGKSSSTDEAEKSEVVELNQKQQEKEDLDAEEQFWKDQEAKREEARRMTLELREQRELERLKQEWLKEEERQKEREKRQGKENQLMTSLQANELRELKREFSIKQDRVKQEMTEAERERQRHEVQTPGAIRKLPVVPLRTVAITDEDRQPTSMPPMQPLVVKSPRKVEKAPSYLGQKPVLLSPNMGLPAVKTVCTPDEPWYIKEEDFDPDQMFSDQQIDGRQILLIRVPKDGPLDMHVEGGSDSPLAGRVIVTDILEGGSVQRHGGIHKHDQLMMVNGTSLLDVTLSSAQKSIQDAYLSKADMVQFIVAVAPPKEYEDEITYF